MATLGVVLEILFDVFFSALIPSFTRRKREAPEPKKPRRGDHYLSVPIYRAPWKGFAKDLGWTLTEKEGLVRGEWEGVAATVELPPTFMGGRVIVTLRPARRLDDWEVTRGSWSRGEDRLTGDVDVLPAACRAFLDAHGAELRASAHGVQCELPRCDVEIVGEALVQLGELLRVTPSYRQGPR